MADDVLVLMNKLSEALTPGSAPRFELVKASSVVSVRVNWIWQGRLPCGKFVILDGMPGVGKTTAIMDLIARASRGDAMPGCDHCADPMPIIIVGAEDDWADTIRPRLEAAEADLDHVYFVKTRSGEIFTLPMNTAELRAWVEQTGAKWIHIETIMGVLDGAVNTNNDQEVRRALAPLVDLASELGVLVTCIRHPRKNGAAAAVAAGGGSTAFSAVARVVLFVGFDPSQETPEVGQPRRIFTVAKSNLSAKAESLTFELVATENGHPRVVWGEASPISADDLASAPLQPIRPRVPAVPGLGRPPSAAERFLLSILVDGISLPVTRISALATEAGIPWRTVQRAANSLGVERERDGFQGRGLWTLREEVGQPPVAPYVPDDFDGQDDGACGIYGTTGHDLADVERIATPTRVGKEVLNAP